MGAEDLTDREFGYLKVIKRAPDIYLSSGRKVIMWECKCQLCGNIKIARGDDLRKGSVKSCGCLTAYNGAKRRGKKKCVICGNEFDCSPSANNVTCSRDCRIKYLSQNHKGRHFTDESKQRMSDSRLANPRCEELQKKATDAAKKSPNSGRFATNVHAKDWHLVSPEGEHYYIHSLTFWLRENCKKYFGVEPDSKEFLNIIAGLSRIRRSVFGALPEGQRAGNSYKGWRVIPPDEDEELAKGQSV